MKLFIFLLFLYSAKFSLSNIFRQSLKNRILRSSFIPSTTARYASTLSSVENKKMADDKDKAIINPLKYAKVSESGAALEIIGVNLSIGNNDLISKIEWTIMPNERWALVGQNGAGKSTLLKALTGCGGENVAIRDGFIGIAKKSRIGYLEQKGVSGSKKTVKEEVSSRMDQLQAAKAALEAAEKVVSDGDYSDAALLKLESASSDFEAAGGYTIDQKIGSILKGLGFKDEDYDRKCSEFSGGWQMRIALARLLLSEPDLLILDEPTNHLDKGARDWLASYLSRYAGTLLVVSHDTNLLETAVNSIAEVRHGRIELYKSRTHDQWLIEREERVKAALAEYEANQREIARLQTFVDRFGAKTMGASLAQSKLKTIEKLEDAAPEAPLTTEGYKAKLILPKPPRGSKVLLELKDAEVSWTAPDSGIARPIIKNVDITIERGMRIVVRGPNGAGKSTLLSALSGKLAPSAGRRIEGDGLELGVFTQDLAQDLDQEAIACDVVTKHVRAKDPSLSDERARSVLGTLGLTGSKAIRKVGLLSGGEKARVALASFVLIPHNLLLLDEPSNHLDVGTLQVLTEALRKFEGSVLVISHDKTFLEELDPTHVITVRDGKVNMEERGLREDDWNDPLDSRGSCDDKFSKSASDNSAATAAKAKTPDPNANKAIKKLESSINRWESEEKELDEEILANGTNLSKLTELQKKKDAISAKIAKAYSEYEQILGDQ